MSDCFFLKGLDLSTKVFLGGTCNNSTWREELIKLLKIDYFNPVVDDWTEECYQEELRQRILCDYCLYVITPLMTGTYSIAEVVDDSNKRPEKTIFCVLKEDVLKGNKIEFDNGSLKSLMKVSEMIMKNGGKFFTDLKSVSEFLNGKK